MNVLLFVFSILMLMAILTTARLNSFLDFYEVRSQYRHYMSVTERSFLQKRADDLYQNQNRSKSSNEDGEGSAISKLRFSFFPPSDIDSTGDHRQRREIVVRLIDRLIEGETLYGEMILRRLEEAALEIDFSTIGKLETVRDLADIPSLFDAELGEIWCRLLAGSLGDYINVKQSDKMKSNQVRLYLAKRELLEAIFVDKPGLVEQIMETRWDIFKNYPKDDDGGLHREASELRLETLVSRTQYASLLDTKVSRTRPSQD